MAQKKERKVLRKIVNDKFSFGDLSPKLKGVTASTGNIYCPFHQNDNTPAAKVYFNEDENIFVIHCFSKCGRSFTAFDYVEKILCEKDKEFYSVEDFLEHKLGRALFETVYKEYRANFDFLQQSLTEELINYIDNTYAKYENALDYIEELYTHE